MFGKKRRYPSHFEQYEQHNKAPDFNFFDDYEEQQQEATNFWDDFDQQECFNQQNFWDDDEFQDEFDVNEQKYDDLKPQKIQGGSLIQQLMNMNRKVATQKSKDQQSLTIQIENGQRFEDQSFPKTGDSIGQLSNYNPYEMKWGKLSEIYQDSKIFGKIEPNDIKQQGLGDCYFLAGIAALAEFPHRITNLFLDKKVNQFGYFQVKMLYRGIWRNIILDQYVPLHYNKPAFCATSQNQIWAIVLQKAWAKLFRNYKAIQAGFLYQPLRALTGAPVVQYHLKQYDKDELFQKIKQSDQKKYCMLASTKSGSDQHTNDIGIAFGHAYSLLGAYQVNFHDQLMKLFKLRNPWGQGQSKGHFSDQDPAWNEISQEDRTRLGYSNCNDGIFFITIHDFYDSFANITVAQIQDSYSYLTCSVKGGYKNAHYFKVKVQHQGKYNFQFDQTPFRSFKQKFSYKKNDLTLLVGKVLQNGKIDYMQGAFERHDWIQQTYMLTPGNYIVYVKNNNINGMQDNQKFSLSIYCQYPCQIIPSNKKDCINFLPMFLMNGSIKKGSKQNVGPNRTFTQTVFSEGFTTFLIENNSNRPFIIELVHPQADYVHFKRNFKDMDVITLEAKPGEKKMAIARCKESRYRGINISSIKVLS